MSKFKLFLAILAIGVVCLFIGLCIGELIDSICGPSL